VNDEQPRKPQRANKYRTPRGRMTPLTPERLAALKVGDVIAVQVPGLPSVSLQLQGNGRFLLHGRGGVDGSRLLGLPAIQRVARADS
jgi:hypothetical protein